MLTLLFYPKQLDRLQYSLDAQTEQFNMQTRNTKRKNFDSNQVSQTKKPKLEQVFPIETFLQNPGYQLIARNIFKYLKLKDFSNCCLVSKGWKQFIDGDKYLANVQLTEVMSLYSERKYRQGFTLFHFVCYWGSLRIVKLFLDNKKKMDIDVNASDDVAWTPLHYASRFNNPLVVKQLLNHGLNVTLRTKKNTAHIIHSAAHNKDPKVIQAVFESSQLININKNVTNFFSATVFHYAAENSYSHKPLLYLLKNATKFNLNINQLDNDQRNVFHIACGFGTEEIVKFLLQNSKKYNIDLNLRKSNGNTPFHLACYRGQLQIVEILLKNSKKHKINIVSKNNAGKDGEALARQKGHTDVVKLIKDWKTKDAMEPFDQMLTKLKDIERELKMIKRNFLTMSQSLSKQKNSQKRDHLICYQRCWTVYHSKKTIRKGSNPIQ